MFVFKQRHESRFSLSRSETRCIWLDPVTHSNKSTRIIEASITSLDVKLTISGALYDCPKALDSIDKYIYWTDEKWTDFIDWCLSVRRMCHKNRYFFCVYRHKRNIRTLKVARRGKQTNNNGNNNNNINDNNS